MFRRRFYACARVQALQLRRRDPLARFDTLDDLDVVAESVASFTSRAWITSFATT